MNRSQELDDSFKTYKKLRVAEKENSDLKSLITKLLEACEGAVELKEIYSDAENARVQYANTTYDNHIEISRNIQELKRKAFDIESTLSTVIEEARKYVK